MTYEFAWRGHGICDGCNSINEMIDRLVEKITMLENMQRAGIKLDETVKDDHAFMQADDVELATRFGLQTYAIDDDDDFEDDEEDMDDYDYDDDDYDWDDEDDDWDNDYDCDDDDFDDED